MEVLNLNSEDFVMIQNLLSQDVYTNLYQLTLLDENQEQLEWTGAFKGAQLCAVNLSIGRWRENHPARMSIPFGDPQGCQALGAEELQKGGTLYLQGHRESCDAFYEGLEHPQTRYFINQRLFFETQKPHPHSFLPLRPARIDEFEQVEIHAGLMQEEDIGVNPRDIDLGTHRQRIAQVIMEQRMLLSDLSEELIFELNLDYPRLSPFLGKYCFMIEIGTSSSRGVQIGNTFVPPEMRRSKLGYLGMRGCAHHLLKKTNVVTLLAKEENLPAVRTHLRAGYRKGAPFRQAEILSEAY
ncbi:MAG: hypothetical protein CMK59_14810 [Proteobacteria bacterium]|nr:hypothetical protein [Pseudomonadota bacterium]